VLTLAIAAGSRSFAARRAFAALVVSLTFALLAFSPPCAWAHAVIVAAHPAMGSTLDPGAVDIRLEFNSRIDVRRSALSLLRPDGTRVALTSLPGSGPGILAARAEASAAGTWTLEWQVLSLDGHITRGVVTFSVRERAP
jgi:methionine-rich copper-binding protein CopC